MKRALAVAVLLLPVSVFAQAPAPQSAVATAAGTWEGNMKWITMAADQMPEADYAYKPVSTVRSFGQLIGHIAGAQYMFCAIALGETAKGEGDIEKTVTSKAGLVAALKGSNDYCRRAYAMTDAQATGSVKLFDQDRSKLSVLMQNSTHIAEHYGNIVTYMRMKSMVPPSSQPQPGM